MVDLQLTGFKMFVSHKSNIIQQISETEWECRRTTKGLSKPEYWTWIETITDSDGVVDYSGETGYTIVECRDEDVPARLAQLDDYQSSSPEIGTVYNIKWSDKKTKVTVNEVEIETHFTGDDTAKDARLLAEEWTRIRAERDRLLAETDWMTFSDSPTMSEANKTYRQKLRDLPSDQSSKKTYADITWPSKP